MGKTQTRINDLQTHSGDFQTRLSFSLIPLFIWKVTYVASLTCVVLPDHVGAPGAVVAEHRLEPKPGLVRRRHVSPMGERRRPRPFPVVSEHVRRMARISPGGFRSKYAALVKPRASLLCRAEPVYGDWIGYCPGL